MKPKRKTTMRNPFVVWVREVWARPLQVHARDAKEAIAKVADGGGEETDQLTEYSHVLPPESWTAEEKKT